MHAIGACARFDKLHRICVDDQITSLLLLPIACLASTLKHVEVTPFSEDTSSAANRYRWEASSGGNALADIRLTSVTIKSPICDWSIYSVPLFCHAGLKVHSVVLTVKGSFRRFGESSGPRNPEQRVLDSIASSWSDVCTINIQVDRQINYVTGALLATNLREWHQIGLRLLRRKACPVKEFRMDSLVYEEKIQTLRAEATATGRKLLLGDVVEEIILGPTSSAE